MLLILTLLLELLSVRADSRVFFPCSPESELLDTHSWESPSSQFCQKWNPDFKANGQQCCGKLPLPRRGRRKRAGRCTSHRGNNYCLEISPEQKEYANSASTEKLGDLLNYLTREMGRGGDQAYCTVNNGFLVRGRPIVSSPSNRLILRSPERCLNYGTDAMAAMIEWLGREVARVFSDEAFSGVRLILGDVSGPKGGCLVGRSGRRGHASHTSGQDADVGFLSVKRGKPSPNQFIREFDPVNNWWLLKKIFNNPYGCVKAIFLGRRHIRALAKFARSDEDWNLYKKFVRPYPGHENHFHVRIGIGPGKPGCIPGAKPELEIEEDYDLSDDPDDTEILDELKARQSMNVQE